MSPRSCNLNFRRLIPPGNLVFGTYFSDGTRKSAAVVSTERSFPAMTITTQSGSSMGNNISLRSTTQHFLQRHTRTRSGKTECVFQSFSPFRFRHSGGWRCGCWQFAIPLNFYCASGGGCLSCGGVWIFCFGRLLLDTLAYVALLLQRQEPALFVIIQLHRSTLNRAHTL